MRVTRIELAGFRRFALSNYKLFCMDIESPLQLIIGTNGSGKSSLLEQLSPFPPNPSDFEKDGYKIQHIVHNGHDYKLKYVFFPKRECHFVFDGVELNDGGTTTVQAELAKEHFGLTPEIFALMLDKELFTAMSPNRRKEWFLKLCDVNYDYAIRVYNKAREAHRDTAGALKLTKHTLALESAKLIGDESIDLLKAEVHQLHEILRELLEIRKPVEDDPDIIDSEQSQRDRDLWRLSKEVNTLFELVSQSPYNVSDYESMIRTSREAVVAHSALLNGAVQEHKKVSEKYEILLKAEAKSITTLKSECEGLLEQMGALHKRSILPVRISDPHSALGSFYALRDALLEIFAELPYNPDQRYTSAALDESKAKLDELVQLRRVKSEGLETTLASIRHMAEHKASPNTKCPKCEHSFSNLFDPTRLALLERNKETFENAISKELGPAIEKLEVFLKDCGLYAQLYRRYVGFTRANRALEPYWNYLQDKKVMLDSRNIGPHLLQEIFNDLQIQAELDVMDKVHTEKNALLNSLKLVGSDDLQTVSERLEELNQHVSEQTNSVQQHSQDQARYTLELRRLQTFTQSVEQMRKVIREKAVLAKTMKESIRRQTLNQLIRDLQSELAHREQRIGLASHQKAIVGNLEKQIKAYADKEDALNILVKELSPTEGLIAEGLMGFMNGFVEQMNAIIRAVWSYQLVIQTCELVEGTGVDLDYRFPMKVQNTPKLVSDVSKGSAGMLEIINLAFKINAMRCLGLHNSPLILDELGAAMDPLHKQETVQVIKALVEQRTFPQVFFISHDIAQYGGLANCQIALLNNLNVVAPSGAKVNQHVTTA